MSNSDGMSNLGKALLDQYLAPANARTKRANERLEAAKEAARIADENAKQALEKLFISIEALLADFETMNVALARAQAENRTLQAKIDAALELDDKQHAQLEWIERSLISKQAQVKHLNARDDIILSVSEVALLVSLVRKHYPIREPLSTEAKINENLKERLLSDDAK